MVLVHHLFISYRTGFQPFPERSVPSLFPSLLDHYRWFEASSLQDGSEGSALIFNTACFRAFNDKHFPLGYFMAH